MHLRVTIKWYQHNKDNFDFVGGQHYSTKLSFLQKNDHKGIVNGNCQIKLELFSVLQEVYLHCDTTPK